MGRSSKIVSLYNGFMTLAGGRKSLFCGARVHRLVTVMSSITGYVQGLNQSYEE